jgi:hypothetical protein
MNLFFYSSFLGGSRKRVRSGEALLERCAGVGWDAFSE